MERLENLMVFLPQDAAVKLVAGKDENARQAALLKGEIFLNAEPVTIWHGIGFSTTIHTAGTSQPAEGSVAVELFSLFLLCVVMRNMTAPASS